MTHVNTQLNGRISHLEGKFGGVDTTTNELKNEGKAIENILNSNPAVSRSVISQYRELEKKLHKLGVDTKPHYTLSPPLGGAIVNLRYK